MGFFDGKGFFGDSSRGGSSSGGGTMGWAERMKKKKTGGAPGAFDWNSLQSDSLNAGVDREQAKIPGARHGRGGVTGRGDVPDDRPITDDGDGNFVMGDKPTGPDGEAIDTESATQGGETQAEFGVDNPYTTDIDESNPPPDPTFTDPADPGDIVEEAGQGSEEWNDTSGELTTDATELIGDESAGPGMRGVVTSGGHPVPPEYITTNDSGKKGYYVNSAGEPVDMNAPGFLGVTPAKLLEQGLITWEQAADTSSPFVGQWDVPEELQDKYGENFDMPDYFRDSADYDPTAARDINNKGVGALDAASQGMMELGSKFGDFSPDELKKQLDKDVLEETRGNYRFDQKFLQGVMSGNNDQFNANRDASLQDFADQGEVDRLQQLSLMGRQGIGGSAMGHEQMRITDDALRRELAQTELGWDEADRQYKMAAAGQSGTNWNNMGGMENTQADRWVTAAGDHDQMLLDAAKEEKGVWNDLGNLGGEYGNLADNESNFESTDADYFNEAEDRKVEDIYNFEDFQAGNRTEATDQNTEDFDNTITAAGGAADAGANTVARAGEMIKLFGGEAALKNMSYEDFLRRAQQDTENEWKEEEIKQAWDMIHLQEQEVLNDLEE